LEGVQPATNYQYLPFFACSALPAMGWWALRDSNPRIERNLSKAISRYVPSDQVEAVAYCP
jgi:hypothetical protein